MMLNNSGLLFPAAITFSSPGSVAFYLGNWPVRWYGIFVACGFLAAYLIAEYTVKKNNLDLVHFNNLIFLILILGVICARIWFVFLSRDYFKYHLSEIPKIWYGGQSIHGGIFGAVLATVLYTKFKQISFYKYIDLVALVAPIGQAIGRWGNFFNSEAFGIPVANWIFRVYIPVQQRPHQYISSEYFHPTFFYESLIDLVIFLFLYKKYSKWKNKPGQIFWFYLLSYSTIRFFLEFLRVDSLHLFYNLASAHVVSIIIILISLIALYRRKIISYEKKSNEKSYSGH